MKSNLFKFIFAVSVIYLAGMYFLGKNHSKEVLGLNESKISTSTPAPTITPSPTPPPTPTPTETPNPPPMDSAMPTTSPSAQPTSAPAIPAATSAEINSFIDRFSAQYGVDPNVLRYIAICESGFRSNAKNGPYIGLYQFGEITWKNLRQEFGEDTNTDLRYSAEESVQTASYALSHGKGGIWPNCQP